MLNCGVFLYERKTFFRGMVMVVLRGIFGGSLATLYPFFLKSPAYFRHSRVYFKSTGIVLWNKKFIFLVIPNSEFNCSFHLFLKLFFGLSMYLLPTCS